MTFSPIPFSCAAFSQSCSYFLVMPAKAGNQTLRQHGFPPRRDAKKLRCPPHQNAAAAAFLTGLDSGVKAKNKIGSSSFNLVKYLGYGRAASKLRWFLGRRTVKSGVAWRTLVRFVAHI